MGEKKPHRDWKATALLLGFDQAADLDECPPLLVVFNEEWGIHFTGPRAWKEAVDWWEKNHGA